MHACGANVWHPTPVLLPGKSHGRRSLVGCSPWGRWESDMTERLHFHFSLSCIGEGNGNPLQCSCLENPRDGGAWWAAIYGVAQSQTRLKRLSSSSRINVWMSSIYAYTVFITNWCSSFLRHLFFLPFCKEKFSFFLFLFLFDCQESQNSCPCPIISIAWPGVSIVRVFI